MKNKNVYTETNNATKFIVSTFKHNGQKKYYLTRRLFFFNHIQHWDFQPSLVVFWMLTMHFSLVPSDETQQMF